MNLFYLILTVEMNAKAISAWFSPSTAKRDEHREKWEDGTIQLITSFNEIHPARLLLFLYGHVNSNDTVVLTISLLKCFDSFNWWGKIKFATLLIF